MLFDCPTKTGPRAAMPGVHWPVYVFMDIPADTVDILDSNPLHQLHNTKVLQEQWPPKPATDCPTNQHLSMLIEGRTIQGIKAVTLLDTGATANFISPRLLEQLKLPCKKTDAKLRLADDSESTILGEVLLKLKLQHLTVQLPCFVTGLCDEFDVILGNAFFIEHRAVLDFANSTVTLSRDGKHYRRKAAQPKKQSGYCTDTDSQVDTDDITVDHTDVDSNVSRLNKLNYYMVLLMHLHLHIMQVCLLHLKMHCLPRL